MRRSSSLLSALTLIGSLIGLALPAGASHAPATATSYINPDTGAATANPNVAPNSDCGAPDREDSQQLSDAGTTNRNVHNDACLLDENGADYSGPVTWESTGVGVISGCPDPDSTTASNGPGVAFTHDHDGNGRVDHCHQSVFQTKGAAGDGEYHARLNNDTTAGDQAVTFCYDTQQDSAAAVGAQPTGHGCSDQTDALKDTSVVQWTTAAPAPASAASYINPDAGTATANPSVNADSDCDLPDREDRQVLSPTGTTTRNVHNDACLRDSFGDDFNAVVTYESTGVGYISGCPDPDSVTDSSGMVVSNGAGVAFTHDHDGDTLADHCHLSGFQAKGADGDGEYHARLNNITEAGDQTVVFCSDPEQDSAMAAGSQPSGHGCADSTIKDSVLVHWLTGDPVAADSALSIRRDRPNFTGRVTSDEVGCLGGRTITLRKVKRGPDATVGTATSDDEGGWTIRRMRAGGRYYAKVSPSVFTDLEGIEVTCSRARSRTISVG